MRDICTKVRSPLASARVADQLRVFEMIAETGVAKAQSDQFTWPHLGPSYICPWELSIRMLCAVVTVVVRNERLA